MLRKLICLPALFIALSISLSAQIQSGPMLGYNTMKEVLVWVQTEKAQKVEMQYWPTEQEARKQSVSLKTQEETARTAKLIAHNLEPGTTYRYQIFIEGEAKTAGTFTTQKLWQHREEPPNWSMATGSCAYTNEAQYDRPGRPYGQGNKIYDQILSHHPEMMLWLGDNIYLREPDWSSKSGIQHRYTHFKSMPEIQELWKSMHHYAIWDDHDFGPNDADRSYVGKEMTLAAFQNFWGNAEYGINGKPGITSQFSFNDVDFFLLDNRYNRSPNHRKTGKQQILGEEQIQWLIDALVNSKSTFKIVAVGGQFLSPAAVYENHATFPDERNQLLQLLEEENLKNVIFLSGDRHKTELTKLELPNGNLVYDYTCSPLTSKSYNSHDEGNTLRVEGTHVATQNFGILEFEGPFEERSLSIKTFDSKGELQWEKVIQKQ
ncbi:MAG: alkaline phosphatase D family protein [Vicingaceae bacterium]